MAGVQAAFVAVLSSKPRNCKEAESTAVRRARRNWVESADCEIVRSQVTRSVAANAFLSSSYFALVGCSVARERRWWAIHHSAQARCGHWERKVQFWHEIAATYPNAGEADDYLDAKYLRSFRVDFRTFEYVANLMEADLDRQITRFRTPVCPRKRLAITLEWLAHSKTFEQLGEKYCLGASTCHEIVHSTVSAMKNGMVKKFIKFPSAAKLQSVMAGFEAIAGLRMCAGAVDGTFVHMQKPAVWGDTYWCYRNFIAILLLGVCDHQLCFTYVDVGRAGCVGDAYTYNESSLKRRINDGTWLSGVDEDINDCSVRPYLIGDSAFPLGPRLLKCYETATYPHQRRFNRAHISTRQKIENAYGFLRGRWRVLTFNFIRDPEFMRDVSLVCCALHNVCQRSNCEYDTHWDIQPLDYTFIGPALPPVRVEDLPGGSEIRFAIASSL